MKDPKLRTALGRSSRLCETEALGAQAVNRAQGYGRGSGLWGRVVGGARGCGRGSRSLPGIPFRAAAVAPLLWDPRHYQFQVHPWRQRNSLSDMSRAPPWPETPGLEP